MYYLVLARACDSLPEGASAQVRVGFEEKPGPGDIQAVRLMAEEAFEQGVGRRPARVGQAVLPWIDSIDNDEDVVVREPAEQRPREPQDF